MAKKATTKKVKEAPVNEKSAEKAVALVDALLMYQNDTTINTHLVNDGLTDEQKKCVAILDRAMCPLSDMELSRLVLEDVLEDLTETSF